MSLDLIIVVSIFSFAVLVSMIVFIIIMKSKKGKRIKVNSDRICPEHIEVVYEIWCSSFLAWTFIHYFLNLLCIICSLATVFFAAKNNFIVDQQSIDNSIVIILSLITALLTTIGYFLSPKEKAYEFQETKVKIEQDILDFLYKKISEEELIEKYKKVNLKSLKYSFGDE